MISNLSSKITIGIDARIFITGIGRVVENLLLSIEKEMGDDISLIVFLRKDGFRAYQPKSDRITKVLADIAPYSFAEQIKLWWIIKKYKVDLMHFTNFNAPLLYPGPFVLTIYDLIHLSYSTFGNSTKNYRYYLFKKFVYRIAIWFLAHRAQKITTISKVSKNEIVKHLKVDPTKIINTSIGFDHVSSTKMDDEIDSNLKGVLDRYDISMPYILYVATMYPHKNHATLLQALSELIQSGVKVQLVFVGKVDELSKKVRTLVFEMGLSDYVVFPNYYISNGYLPDSELKGLYQNATAVISPSYIEGFGIPILEAQWYEKPMLASDIEIFHEVGGQGVIFFDPHNPRDIAQKIKKVLNHEVDLVEYIRKGRENIKRFLWKDVAKNTISVYRSVLGL